MGVSAPVEDAPQHVARHRKRQDLADEAHLRVLAVVVVPAVLVQSLALVAWARLSGVGVPLDAGPWALYTVELMAVDLALCAFHVWLAAVVENQLVGVGCIFYICYFF